MAKPKCIFFFRLCVRNDKNLKWNAQIVRAYLDLGRLHRARKRTEQAQECISKAVELFEQLRGGSLSETG